MGHGVTWLSFLPGYQQLQDYLREATHNASLFGNALLIQHVVAAVLVVLIVSLVGIQAGMEIRRLGDAAVIPSPTPSLRGFIEVALEWLYNQAHQIIGKDAKRYFPVIGTLALFIFFCNILGLVPGFAPPTDNWNTTAACSIFVFLYYNYHGLRAHGLGHIAHMANPAGTWWGWFISPLMFPIELVSHVARPFSLTVRLAANMVGDHAVLAAFLGLVPVLVPLPFLLLGFIVCLVQTLVFVLLTMIYIGLSVAETHHDEEHDEEHEAAAHA
ncbi:MAG: F0F1 ATP synthase subunit A [Deltaproteobacteria bacterium]|nr:F0F1 ATP synthase subunit A [Deltaproteobacteria bacterium]